jgi:uncharacterized repeat protein (TIGR03803 family)
VIDKHGILYGTAVGGGVNENGTVYSLKPPSKPGDSWIVTVLDSVNGFHGIGSTPTDVGIGPGGVLCATTMSTESGYPGGALFSGTPPVKPGGCGRSVSCKGLRFLQNGPTGPVLVDWPGSGECSTAAPKGGASNEGTVFSLMPLLVTAPRQPHITFGDYRRGRLIVV